MPDYNTDYAFLPIRRPELIEYYYMQRDVRWVPAEVDLGGDRADWDNKCTPGVRKFVKGLLCFFVPSDGIVTENIFSNFREDTSMYKEASAFYAEQAAMEMVHSEMYSLMAQSLIRDQTELNEVFNSIHNYNSIKNIAGFMFKYMGRDRSLAERIVGFACVEGIIFNSAFVGVYWIKKKNILLGFCKANEFIARDEAIHTRFAEKLFKLICEAFGTRPSQEQIYDVIKEAVETNEKFVEDFLDVDLIGLSREDLSQYTKCTADSMLQNLGYEKLYNAENPFDWMTMINLPNKTNFFESKVTEYTQPGEFVFDLDAEF